MSESRKTAIVSWAPIAITVIGWVFLGGVAYQTLKDHERRIQKNEADHDAVVQMSQKLDDVHEWMKAMRDRNGKP